MKQTKLKIHLRLLAMLTFICLLSKPTILNAQTTPDGEVCEPLSTHSKFICKMENRKLNYDFFLHVYNREEISGIAYQPQSNCLFMPLDQAPVPEVEKHNNYIRGYNIENNTAFSASISGYDFDNRTADFEGFAHLKDNYFVLLEEQENRIYFLEYQPDEYQFNVLSGHDTNISKIVKPNTDDDGLEGISYDSNIQRLYLLSEHEVEEGRLFSVALTLPGKGSLGEIHDISSTSLKHIIPGEVASLFHLGKIYPANSPKSNNLLITSKFSSRMWEIGLTLDDENNLFECSATLISIFNIENEPKPSGVSVIGDKIYFANESNEGGLFSYTLKTENDNCDDVNQIYNQHCTCIEKPACEANLNIPSNNDENNNLINSLNVNYSSTQSINTHYDAVNNHADIIIQQNEAVNLKSDHITLNQGFKVENGGCLNAVIKPCE